MRVGSKAHRDWRMHPLSFIQSRKTTWASLQNRSDFDTKHRHEIPPEQSHEQSYGIWSEWQVSCSGVCTLWQWLGATATTCEHCAALERSRAGSPCARRDSRSSAMVLDLPAGAPRWASFGLCCSARSHRWFTNSVSWSATSKDLTMSEIPIATTEKGQFATMAWWKSGILDFPSEAREVSLTPLPWWKMEPFLSNLQPAVDHGHSGRHQAAEPCLSPASTDCSLI